MAIYARSDLAGNAPGTVSRSMGSNSGGSFIDWLNEKGSQFVAQQTGSNPYSFKGVNAVYDELGLGHRVANESALEDNYNEAKSGYTYNDLLAMYESGQITAKEFQSMVASNGVKLTGSQSDYLNTILSDQNTQEEYQRGLDSIMDSALATQEAAIATGMNPTAYMMSQGAASNPGVSRSESDMSNSRADRLARFERNTQMAKTLIGIAGSMASTGIYGTAMYAAKSAASKLVQNASKTVYGRDGRMLSQTNSRHWFS